jgi:hypothetical protein
MLRLSLVALAAMGGCQAFSPALPLGSMKLRTAQPSACQLQMLVKDIKSAAEMDEIVKASGTLHSRLLLFMHMGLSRLISYHGKTNLLVFKKKRNLGKCDYRYRF